MIPVTYFPVGTQHLVERNRAHVAGQPYAHFFREEMWLRDEVLPFLRRPMDPAHALRHHDQPHR